MKNINMVDYAVNVLGITSQPYLQDLLDQERSESGYGSGALRYCPLPMGAVICKNCSQEQINHLTSDCFAGEGYGDSPIC